MKYILIAALALFIGAYWEQQTDRTAMRDALTTCQVAHENIDGASEQACGDAQDRTGTEFVCNQTGEACWLEVK